MNQFLTPKYCVSKSVATVSPLSATEIAEQVELGIYLLVFFVEPFSYQKQGRIVFKIINPFTILFTIILYFMIFQKLWCRILAFYCIKKIVTFSVTNEKRNKTIIHFQNSILFYLFYLLITHSLFFNNYTILLCKYFLIFSYCFSFDINFYCDKHIPNHMFIFKMIFNKILYFKAAVNWKIKFVQIVLFNFYINEIIILNNRWNGIFLLLNIF